MIELEFGDSGNLPAAARFAYVADDYGEAFVFFPTDARERDAAYLAAGFDGVGLYRGHRGKVYFPTRWLAREYPAHKDDFERMKNVLVERARETGGGTEA